MVTADAPLALSLSVRFFLVRITHVFTGPVYAMIDVAPHGLLLCQTKRIFRLQEKS